MKTFIISYSLVILFLLILDGIWLSIMLPNVYKPNLSHLLSETIHYFPAIIFYLIYAFGLYFFVINNVYEKDFTISKIFLYSFLFGAVCYSTYDLTNQATLKNWPPIITIIDILWGGALTSITSILTVTMLRRL